MRQGPFDATYDVPPLGPPLAVPRLAPFAGAGARPKALVVGGSAERRGDLGRELRERGWEVAECAGPLRTRCPLLDRRGCELREAADVAAVFTDAERPLATIACGAHSSSPAVMVLQSRSDAPRTKGDRTVVGAVQPVETLASAVESLLP